MPPGQGYTSLVLLLLLHTYGSSAYMYKSIALRHSLGVGSSSAKCTYRFNKCRNLELAPDQRKDLCSSMLMQLKTSSYEVVHEQVEQKLLKPLPRRDVVDAIFQRIDVDGDGSISFDEFFDMLHEFDSNVTEESTIKEFVRADIDPRDNQITEAEFYQWMSQSESKIADQLLDRFFRDQAKEIFDEIDTDENGGIDAKELQVVAKAMGLKWTFQQTVDVLKSIDVDGNNLIDFAEFFDWFYKQNSSSEGMVNALGAKLRVILRKRPEVDCRSVMVRGIPHNATQQYLGEYFQECGEIESITLLNWSRDGKPSGRCIIVFKDSSNTEKALKMHRRRMGPKYVEVYRLNIGDKEERLALDKSLHSSILGRQGLFLQRLENESGARLFLQSNETDGWVMVKGTYKEREAAKRMISEAIVGWPEAGVACDSIDILSSEMGRVIGKSGRKLSQVVTTSGAQVSFQETSESEVKVIIHGMPGQRKVAMELIRSSLNPKLEESYKLPEKYHGNLRGKGAICVRAMEEATNTTIKFSKEDGGLVKIKGDPDARTKAWSLIAFAKQELPGVLSLLRQAAVEEGSLRSKPGFSGAVSKEDVWTLAVEEILFLFSYSK
eukprot:766967-Hanusia_phi.AAC.6